MAISNYEQMRDAMRGEFLKYDQQKMIAKFGLRFDEDYLYLPFVGRQHRINRHTGRVEGTADGFRAVWDAGYEESMTIYDVLCYSKDNCCLSGKFCSVRLLKGTAQFSGNGIDLFQTYADGFQGRRSQLRAACEGLGRPMTLSGDLAYQLDIFPFLPVILQYWDADDEFPACLKIMFDENILDYMHYETTYFLTGHLLARLEEESKRSDYNA